MFCEQCGKKINDDAKFCKYCGSPTGVTAEEVKREDPAAEIKQEAPAFAEEAKKEKKFSLPKREKKVKKEKKEKKAEKTAGKGKLKKILLGIILLVVAVLAIRAGVNYYLSNKIVGQIPDPIEYFGMTPDEDKEYDSYTHTIIFRSEENVGLKEKAKGYIALLKSGAYPFDLGSENAFQSGDFNCYFSYSGNENIGHAWIRTIEIEYYDKTNGRDNYAVWITIHDSGNFELVSIEQGEASVAAEQQEETFRETPEFSGVEELKITTPTLPDLLAFIGGNGSPMKQGQSEGEVGQEYGYKMGFEDGWIAANEYVELLANDPRFHLSMQPRKAEDSETISYLKSEVYTFDYVGDHDITPATIRYYQDGYHYTDADVRIEIQKNGKDGTTSIVIWHSNDFTVADLGDRASTAPSGASGSSGGSVPNSSTQSARKPCPYCDDGDCDKCGGDGYLHSLASDKEDRNCPALYCNNGRCSYCGGDGWYE